MEGLDAAFVKHEPHKPRCASVNIVSIRNRVAEKPAGV